MQNIEESEPMKKLVLNVFLLISMIGSTPAAHSTDFDQYMEGARYLEEYQAKQKQYELINKGIWFLLLLATGIVVGIILKKKAKK